MEKVSTTEAVFCEGLFCSTGSPGQLSVVIGTIPAQSGMTHSPLNDFVAPWRLYVNVIHNCQMGKVMAFKNYSFPLWRRHLILEAAVCEFY